MAHEASPNGKPLSDEEFDAQLLTLPVKYNEQGEATLHGMTIEEVRALKLEPTADDIAWAEGVVAEHLAAQK